MNLCIVSEYKCNFEEFEAVIEKSHEESRAFVSDYELVKVNDHKSVLLIHCTDMEALLAFMATPEMKQWDKENECVDTIYSMEPIN